MKNFLRRFSTLQIALGVSIAVHAALLTVRFVDPLRIRNSQAQLEIA